METPTLNTAHPRLLSPNPKSIMMSAYTYTPLPKNHIRLLNIETSSKILSGSLSTHALYQTTDYVALSYAWGLPSSTLALNCSGGVLPVHNSLHSALQELRARGFQKPIWIDALCINQDDEKEKNHQIPLMRHIYSQASKVLVWLGCASTLEEEALTALPGIVASLDQANSSLALWNARSNPSKEMDIIYANLGLPAPKSAVWPTLCDLLARSWFKRLWVLQEVAVAKKVEVLCGSTTVEWSVLAHFPRVVYKHRLTRLVSNKEAEDEGSREGFDLLKGFNNCRLWLSKMPEHGVFLPHILQSIRMRDVTNSLDKIYGILGLVPKPLQDSIVVDYSRTPAQVYADFARYMVSSDGDFSLLSEVGGTRTTKLDGLPSWCPNFDSPGPLSPFGGQLGRKSGYHAGFRPPFEYKCGIIKTLSSNIITVPGFVIDRIEAKVNERRVSYPLNAEGCRVLLKWDEECLKLAQNTYLMFNDVPLPYSRTLIAQRILDFDGMPRQSNPDCTATYKEWKAYLQNRAKKGRGHQLSTDAFHYTTTVGNTQLGRAFFATNAGRIGLGPSELKPGDFVCIFDNGLVPFILRYTAPNMPALLVGEAYVDGLMYGEALIMQDIGLIEPVKISIA